MTNAQTDTIQAALDNGTIVDERSVMLTSARAIVSILTKAEGELSTSAKAWGTALFRQCYPADGAMPANMDSLIGDTKTVADWQSLSASDTGKKIKGRLEVYFSNARLVAENWNGLVDTLKAELLAGTASIHYQAGLIRKANADAAKAAKKADAAAKAETAKREAEIEAKDSASDVGTVETVEFSPLNAVELLTLAFDEMDAAGMAEISDAFNAMVMAYDARLNALTGEPEAKAA